MGILDRLMESSAQPLVTNDSSFEECVGREGEPP